MSVVLGKRLRADPGVKPARHRAEVTGMLSGEDPLAQLCRLFPAVPRDALAEVLGACAGDFQAAVVKARSLFTCQEAEDLVDKCAVAASLPEAAHVIETGLRAYHEARRESSSAGVKQVESLLRENSALKKLVRFLHDKLQKVSAEAEEGDRIRGEIEREREVKAALLFHLHRCSG